MKKISYILLLFLFAFVAKGQNVPSVTDNTTINVDNSGTIGKATMSVARTYLDGYYWKRLGNSGTTAGTDFIGTTDAQNLVFKTNSVTRATLNTSGQWLMNNGSESLPVYSFTNSATSGSYWDGSNLAFSVAGNRRMYLSSYGVLNIGDPSSTSNTFINGGRGAATGSYNCAVGFANLSSLTSGGNNTAIGTQNLTALTTGSNNLAIGSYSLTAISTTSSNLGIGFNAGFFLTGSNCVAIGENTLQSTSGNSNVAIGKGASQSVTSGENNVVIGASAGTSNTSGSNNTIIGGGAMFRQTQAQSSIVIGSESVGYTDPSSFHYNNNIVIGNSTQALAQNTINIGNSNITEFNLRNNLISYTLPSSLSISDDGKGFFYNYTTGKFEISSASNLYSANGTLTAARTITNAGYNLNISGTGNLTVGGTTYNSKLNIENTDASKSTIVAVGTAASLNIGFSGTGVNNLDGTTTNFRTYAGSTYATFNSTGLGIGTSSHTEKLHLYGSTTTNAVIESSSTASAAVKLKNTNNDISLLANNASTGFTIYDNTNSVSVLKYFPNSYTGLINTGSGGAGLTVNTSGQVGVNTTAQNSTLGVSGSISLPFSSTSAASFTLTDAYYTLRLTLNGAQTITLPAASSCSGRIYIILIPTSGTKTISSYIDLSGTTQTTTNGTTMTLQSDGSSWYRIQ